MTRKTVGILGGMGPKATTDFMNKIIDHTDADRDQEHLPMLVFNDPHIPSRLDSISGVGEDIAPMLLEHGKRLVAFGADFLVMPCNTAHYYYDYVNKNCGCPMISIIETAIDHLRALGIKKIGVAGTEPTIQLGLYQKPWMALGYEAVIPSDDIQTIINRMIASVKANTMHEISKTDEEIFFNYFRTEKVEAIVLACTELPVYFAHYQSDIPIIDPTLILALQTIQFAGYKVR